ncbi:MAG: SUMF1/EgtB/PvdO family nonheme iron enzyme, partial [Anaerolineae bacterium]|nr:SUMF1/EgtB/PvdO family nonheme iron enzyme [Anaerolineae bacterium]
MHTVPRIRIFLSSPSDVADERQAAHLVVDRLSADPLLHDQIDLDVVAWDDPDAATPMLATLTPQEAINRGFMKPSNCEIVIVIFWARMGTPLASDFLKPNGERYLSGTEWEYWDAVNASWASADELPMVVVYRRDGAPALYPNDPQFSDTYEQWQRVQAFFAAFTDPDGTIRQGYHRHTSTADFARQLETHLKKLIKQVIDIYGRREVPPPSVETPHAPLWEGSPFPGLRAFTPTDEPIFFGRGAETDGLLDRLRGQRVVAVVGASGSGKSSLVGTGLLPRLAANSIDGSKDWLLPSATNVGGTSQWHGLRFTPGEVNDNPFDALAARLAPMVGRIPRDVSAALAKEPSALLEMLDEALASRPDWAQALLFIDQFEELFTLCAVHYRAPFIALLMAVSKSERTNAVLTLRADFYARCVQDAALRQLLEAGTFPLSTPGQAALYEMITRPAERAGLAFEDGLVARIFDDTGDDPGALSLLAYALDELYRRSGGKSQLTHADYEAIGKVQGAIGKRAEVAFAQLSADARAAFATVFRELVEVDERGEPIRRRANLESLAADAGARALIDRLTDERLLVMSQGDTGATVEVAHEALMRNWDQLRLWIDGQVRDLQLRGWLETEAQAWKEADDTKRSDFVLLSSRLEEAERWAEHFPAPSEVRAFIDASIVHRAEQIAAEERRKKELRDTAERAQEAQREAQREAQQAQLATANARASAEHAERQRKRARNAVGVTAAIVVIALIAGTLVTSRATSQINSANERVAGVEPTLAAADAELSHATATLGFVQDQVTQVVALATYFGREQARIGTLVAGVAMNPLAGATQEPTAFLATLTQVAELNTWQPVMRLFDGVEMVQVPAGCFWMGSAELSDTMPPHEICFDAAFWIDRYEVTQGQFGDFNGVIVGDFSFLGENHPVDRIGWLEALKFCELRGMRANADVRLPTEAEWEYAARGPNSLRYPWGNEWNENYAVWTGNSTKTADVGSHPEGASWVGALDMSGNVWEW